MISELSILPIVELVCRIKKVSSFRDESFFVRWGSTFRGRGEWGGGIFFSDPLGVSESIILGAGAGVI